MHARGVTFVKRLNMCLAVGILALLVILAACSASAGSGEPTPPPTLAAAARQTPPGPRAPPAAAITDKWALWSSGTQLRGANIYQRRVYPELDGPTFMGPGPVGPPYSQADFDRLAALGANYVNISHPGLFDESPPYALAPGIQANLDAILDKIAQADMFAVISFRTGPGRSEFTFFWGSDDDWFDASYYNDQVWKDAAAQDAWAAMWRYTAERYRDNPIVVGYDLMVEPNANEVWLNLWDPDEFYATYGGTLYDWNQLYPRITDAIRQVDPYTPILIGGMAYSPVDWLPYVQPTGDPRTVYTVHQYAPHAYTHQEANAQGFTYPGFFDTDWDGVAETFDRTWLENWLATVDGFKSTHGVPVASNEFGLVRWAPDAAAFMDDQMDMFEARGMNYALWLWETSWPEYAASVDAFNFRHGPDPNNHTDVVTSTLMGVITDHWGRNTVRPSSMPTETAYLPVVTSTFAPMPALSDVDDFLYQLQNLDLAAVGATAYDLVITDYSSDGSEAGEFTATEIDALKHSPGGPKIVLAYMSIGEAEEYRFYWQDGWGPGSPPWLDAENPDWPGNYKVHYWDPDWQDIIFAYTDRLLEAGFDGAYLDIVDAYEYYAEAGRATAAQEMADFVAAIRARAQARDPDFLIVPQNAPELAALVPAYMNSVDGIGQEDIYYGYEADDQATPPAVTAELEGYLDLYKAAGKPVFTTDYATTPAHVDDAYAKSLAQGYVPFVTVRDLDQLTVNPGHEPD